MKCPRCSYEWDVRQSPCPRCHLHLRTVSQLGPVSLIESSQASSLGGNTVQVQSSHQLEFDGKEDVSLPTLFNDSESLKPPSTGRLDPKRTFYLPENEASASDVQKLLSSARSFSSSIQQPVSDTSLHRNRYSLQKKIHRQAWPLGIVETTWAATDMRLARSPVVIHELSVPNEAPKEAQALSHRATKALIAIGRDLHAPALRDVFSDREHNYFVFEAIEGLSLSTLMFNNGGRLPEQEVIACCLQIAELLFACSQLSPMLIHGNIRPEYILKKPDDSRYVLINFSVALVGGLVEILADTNNVLHTKRRGTGSIPGRVDGYSDLSALLEIAYYAAMGQRLSDTKALETNSTLSKPFLHAILSKGLLASPHQGYKNAEQLYHEMVLLHDRHRIISSSASRVAPGKPHVSSSVVRVAPGKPRVSSSVAPEVQAIKDEHRTEDFILPAQLIEEVLERTLLVPLPEELPPLKQGHDLRNAAFLFAGMIFVLVLLLGRGFI